MKNSVQSILNRHTSSAFDSEGKLLPLYQMAVSGPSKRQEALFELNRLQDSLENLTQELDSLYAKHMNREQSEEVKKLIADTKTAYRLTYEAITSLEEVYRKMS